MEMLKCDFFGSVSDLDVEGHGSPSFSVTFSSDHIHLSDQPDTKALGI